VQGLGTSTTAPSEASGETLLGLGGPLGPPSPTARTPRLPCGAFFCLAVFPTIPPRVRLSVFLLSPAPKPRPHSFPRPLPSPARVSARRAAAMLMRVGGGRRRLGTGTGSGGHGRVGRARTKAGSLHSKPAGPLGPARQEGRLGGARRPRAQRPRGQRGAQGPPAVRRPHPLPRAVGGAATSCRLLRVTAWDWRFLARAGPHPPDAAARGAAGSPTQVRRRLPDTDSATAPRGRLREGTAIGSPKSRKASEDPDPREMGQGRATQRTPGAGSLGHLGRGARTPRCPSPHSAGVADLDLIPRDGDVGSQAWLFVSQMSLARLGPA
jgi:hypothetical protein